MTRAAAGADHPERRLLSTTSFSSSNGIPTMRKGEAIYQKLRNEIHTGKFRPGEKLTRGTELAARYGVAHLTMRRVLERLKQDGLISVRPRIGLFVASPAHAKQVALAFDYEGDRHSVFVRRLQHALVDLGCILNVFETRAAANYPEAFLSAFAIPKDYLIFNGATFFPWDLLKKIPKTTRLVAFHRCEHVTPPTMSHVLADYGEAGRQGVAALLRAGKRRLAVLANDTAVQAGTMFHRFLDGARREAAAAGVRAPELLLDERLPERKGAHPALRRDLDGIVGAQDSFLVPVVEAARAAGRAIPGDLALVGHYNTPWADELGLTSLDIQPDAIIREVVSLIQHGATRQVNVPPRLVYRASCPASA